MKIVSFNTPEGMPFLHESELFHWYHYGLVWCHSQSACALDVFRYRHLVSWWPSGCFWLLFSLMFPHCFVSAISQQSSSDTEVIEVSSWMTFMINHRYDLVQTLLLTMLHSLHLSPLVPEGPTRERRDTETRSRPRRTDTKTGTKFCSLPLRKQKRGWRPILADIPVRGVANRLLANWLNFRIWKFKFSALFRKYESWGNWSVR